MGVHTIPGLILNVYIHNITVEFDLVKSYYLLNDRNTADKGFAFLKYDEYFPLCIIPKEYE